MTPEPTFCLFCNTELKGRIDKQFCNAHCKSLYHNRNPNTKEALIRKVNKQLRTNRSALYKACPQGKATVRKEFLTSLGMDFKFLTHTWRSNGGNLYYFCYDYGYTPSVDIRKVVVIQQQEYMKKP
ncbi:hypothetical protein [Saccharicrinis sp. GN24d3]